MRNVDVVFSLVVDGVLILRSDEFSFSLAAIVSLVVAVRSLSSV